ncbi:acyltransferase family protein [Paraflavitalea pollutisoli]|uniref:acyltransferase family protein n=1 Tax=Paraflavitalea pollutisoli TaxID=3034143 RepID=UPI0023ED39C9|nr:acyltransferase [Paraflavitalea sp. H1-2-19X]
MYIQENHFKREHNNFDALRLLAALLVFASHSTGFYLPAKEPLALLTNGAFHLSHLGLFIFFTLSGFLVCRSLDRSFKDYFRNRLLRIVPALAIWTILMVFLVGPLFTTLPIPEYYKRSQTWYFLIQNMIPVQVAFYLPGVFDGKAVNPSLWTIPLEIKCYIALALAYLTALLKRRQLMAAGWIILLIASACATNNHTPINNFLHPFKQSIQLAACFVGGTTCYLYRDQLPFKTAIWLLLLGSWLGSWAISPAALAVTTNLFFVYTILGLGVSRKVLPALRIDISYGIYLYGAPVQYIIYTLAGNQLTYWQFIITTTAGTILFATLSWLGIEKRALHLKRHTLIPIRQPASQPEDEAYHHKKQA